MLSIHQFAASMIELIGDTVPLAMGILFTSPIPVILVVLILLGGGEQKARMLFVGFLTGLSSFGTVVIAFDLGPVDGDDTGPFVDVMKSALVVVFLLLAFGAWRRRRRSDGMVDEPRWVQTIDRIGPVTSFGVGWGFGALEPTNLGLTSTAAVGIGTAGVATVSQVLVLGLFVAIGGAGVATPLVLSATTDRAIARLRSVRQWLIDNTALLQLAILPTIAAVLALDVVSSRV